MFGFVVGTVSLVMLSKVVFGSHYRHHRGQGRCGSRGRWGKHKSRARRGMAKAAGEVFKRKLGVDEDQEDIINHALADLMDAGKEFTHVLKDSREDIADAFRGETVDEGALAAAFARHDEALLIARRNIVSTFKQIHAVLDDEQREVAADILGQAAPGWSR